MCAELIDALENARRIIEGADGTLHINTAEFVLRRARALLALPTPQPPADGEVAELVAELRGKARVLESQAYPQIAEIITRAADLLERPTHQPVAVSERLPGPEHCTARGFCWVFYKGYATWTLEPPLGQNGKHTGYTHWLPSSALPTPEAKP